VPVLTIGSYSTESCSVPCPSPPDFSFS